MKIICFSSFTFSYLDRARVLFKSLRKYHPEWDLIALITDRPPAEIGFNAKQEPFDKVVYAEDLGVPRFESWIFKHDIVEICTAVKGPFLRNLCDQEADAIVYLDPDICLYDRLDPVIEILATKDIVLTPHLLSPETTKEGILDNEISALRAGIYNLGFVAIKTTGQGLAFAEWWSKRLQSFCYDDIPNGLFVDQRWCDHVPALFDLVHILRDPGYNVASWNIGKRKLSIAHDGRPYVNGHRLRFWHYTKLGPVGDIMTKKYAQSNFEVYELWRLYKQHISESRVQYLPSKYWYYSRFNDGTEIKKAHRVLYRSREDLQNAFENPFETGVGTFHEWLKSEGYASREDCSPELK